MILTIFRSKREKAREAYRQAVSQYEDAKRRRDTRDQMRAELAMRDAMRARLEAGA